MGSLTTLKASTKSHPLSESRAFAAQALWKAFTLLLDPLRIAKPLI
jgi:hypothetical protein